MKIALLQNAKIEDAAITNAKIEDAAITSAKIRDLSVSTLKIQDNAVTLPVVAYTPSYIQSYGDILAQSAAITSYNGSVLVTFSLWFFGARHETNRIWLTRDGNIVWEYNAAGGYGLLGEAIASHTFIDYCGTGTHTYILYASDQGDLMRISHRTICLLDFRK